MLRHPIVLSPGSSGDFPDPVPARSDTYWARSRQQGLASDDDDVASAQAAIEDIDFVQILEAYRPWEVLKLPIFCSFCNDTDLDQFDLANLHWEYLHCTRCPAFFVCGNCIQTRGRLSSVRIALHALHGRMVTISSRPFWSPRFDGGELDQLLAFKDAGDSMDDFFLYFPWFFHCFEGMDRVRLAYQTGLIEDALSRHFSRSSSLSLEDVVTDNILRFVDAPVDWYMRIFATGDWQRLHRQLQPLVDERIHVARRSAALHGLLQDLGGFVEQKIQRFGTDDIPCDPRASAASALDQPALQDKFTAYLMPLHVLSIQNPDIDQAKLRRLLHSRSPGTRATALSALAVPPDETLVLAGNSGIHPQTSHLSNPILTEAGRLWPMFESLFEDDDGFEKLNEIGALNDFVPYMQYTSGEREEFLSLDLAIRSALHTVQYQSLPARVTYLADHPAAARNPLLYEGEDLRQHRLLGDYEQAAQRATEAIMAKRAQRLPHLEEILEAQLNYLEQGYLNKAAACMQHLVRQDGDVNSLIRSSSAAACIYANAVYASSFSEPHGWRQALQVLPDLFWHQCDLSGGAGSVMPRDRFDLLCRVRLEVTFHRTILAVYRDLMRPCPYDSAIPRLHAIQGCLAKRSDDIAVADVLWQVTCLELEMVKRRWRVQYMEEESCFSLTDLLHDPEKAMPVLQRFHASLRGRGPLFDTLRGHALLIEAELHRKSSRLSDADAAAGRAMQLYSAAQCTVGCLDVEVWTARRAYRAVGPLYDALRERNDLTRLRPLRQMFLETTSTDADNVCTTATTWRSRQCIDLRDLAKEAGDMVSYHRWSMRKYAGDEVVGASIQASEAVLGRDASVHSTTLATMASYNLSKAYVTLGNFFAAAVNAMMHLSLTYTQDDAENQQRAILAVLHVFSEAIAATPRLQERLPGLAKHWNGWLNDETIGRWDASRGGCCDEIERFIDGACFLPLLSGRVERVYDDGVLSRDEEFEAALHEQLQIAFDLYATLPVYNASAIVPRLSRALGAVAVYVGNPELAVRCYAQGLRCCHSGDAHSIARLRLAAGKIMVQLGSVDPEHWRHVVGPGRRLLASAADALIDLHLSGTALESTDANLFLLGSLVDEARACKKLFDYERTTAAGDVPLETWALLERVAKLVTRAKDPTGKILRVFRLIADRVNIGSPFELSYNLVHLAENGLFGGAKQLTLELGLIAQDLDQISNQQRGVYFWAHVQRFKATVLAHRYGNAVPRRILQRIQSSAEAWGLYQEEAVLLDEAPHSTLDGRLTRLRQRMAEVPELQPLLLRRLEGGVTMEDMASLAGRVGRDLPSPSKPVVLVDWILYRGHFVICGFNATASELCMLRCIDELGVPELEQWIRDHVQADGGGPLADALDGQSCLRSLRMLVAPIRANCEPGATLVFSPSLCLNRIPLHALPYGPDNDEPVIQHHPVVYAPSMAALKDCVERALDADMPSQLRAALFNCYSGDGALGSQAMDSLASELERSRASFAVTRRDGVTADALRTMLRDADLIHFHGHVRGKSLEQSLGLADQPPERATGDPVPFSYLNANASPRAAAAAADFKLQDVYASSMAARLALLIGCGSGELVVSRGDDALGLVNGFLAAGAAAVVGTLWPMDNQDGRDFARYFYSRTFGPDAHADGGASGLVDIAAAMQAAVRDMRTCQRPRCRRRSPEARLTCHPVLPYHWAPFVGWGSWVLRVPDKKDE